MNLYEITGAVQQLAEMFEEGEIDEQTYNDTVESLGSSIEVEEIVKAIRNKLAEAEMYKAEAERFTKKKQKAEKSVEWLKKVLMSYLCVMNERKLNTSLFCVTRGTSKAVSVYDENVIPEQYMIPQPAKVDKKSILADLKAGVDVPGAHIKETEYITIK